jgi:hypothetical protein
MVFGSLGRRALIGGLVAIGLAFLGPALPSYPLTFGAALIVAISPDPDVLLGYTDCRRRATPRLLWRGCPRGGALTTG